MYCFFEGRRTFKICPMKGSVKNLKKYFQQLRKLYKLSLTLEMSYLIAATGLQF